jgi:muramoyltetrapeptide carboxypeptidase
MHAGTTTTHKLIESADLAIGQFDRALTVLTRAGHSDGVVGILVAHVNGTPPNPPLDAVELLHQPVSGFAVPILGGLPISHHADGVRSSSELWQG